MALHFGRIGFIVPAQTLFLCCDIQERFRSLIPGMSADAGHRSVIRVGQTMLHAARIFDIPTVVTEQYPKALGKTVPELDTTGTQVFEKTLFSMITPEVEANVLNQIQPKSAVLFGIEAHVCVLQTALDLLSRDIEVHIVSDGVDSQKPLDRDTGLLRAQQAGAFITTCESLLFQLMRTKDHPKFKQISALAKERNDQILKASTK